MIHRSLVALGAIAATLLATPLEAANWAVARVNHAALPAPASGVVREMSGVTYVGPAEGAAHRFIAVQQNHENIVRFDVTFTAAGGIATIANVVNIPIDDELDFEGIAYTNATRNSVFVSDENGPGIRELSLANGSTIGTTTVPAVFQKRRDNKGFESLTRSRDALTMWTANEEALTVDGPASTSTASTTVRLLKLAVNGNALAAGPQYAYNVAPIHGSGTGARSGLCDLVVMPDGTLLGLERSAAPTLPAFLSRIFEIDFAGATDVAGGATAAGLIGQPYTPVDKSLLWSGTADGLLGQNFEGLGLGPRLANGAWVLLGVVDGGNNGANTVVALTATANPTADFNGDGAVDGTDFVQWQRGLGATLGATLAQGDADRDGDVDQQDLEVWKAAQAAGSASGAAAPGGEAPSQPAPEPAGAAILAPGLVLLTFRGPARRRTPQSG